MSLKPAILLLGIYSSGRQLSMFRHLAMMKFIAALFVMAKSLKQSK